MTTTVTPLSTFRNETPYPFCPGCGHGPILDGLDVALVELAIDPASVVIVSDIGCSGLSDQYFATSAFHGLHGRSVTYATGIKLSNPELTVIVIMGDGGTGIGGTHLINAARRNIGVTVIVMNNLNFGMTGGQHSTTTPEGAVTATTPAGNLEHPLDVCGTVGVNGAGYVYRGTSFDHDLTEKLVDAIRHPGFALLDIWELCTAYYVRANHFSRRAIAETMEGLGLAVGVLYERDVAEYAASYRAAHAGDVGMAISGPVAVPVEYSSELADPVSMVVAGSAGGRVQSAAHLVGAAAIRSGLWATQSGDYPITVKTGHSIALLGLSPTQLPLVSMTAPEVLLILSRDGLAAAQRWLPTMSPEGVVFTLPEFADLTTAARVEVIDPAAVSPPLGKSRLALAILAAVVSRRDLFPVEALQAAAAAAPFADQNLATIQAGLAL
jgi:pyruvate/2-oxoacid:ferredoxin oxidoreductase beta subunit/Pyruvate/2-oxoacid:ferredoxin oxidoreductase gamma subunit